MGGGNKTYPHVHIIVTCVFFFSCLEKGTSSYKIKIIKNKKIEQFLDVFPFSNS